MFASEKTLRHTLDTIYFFLFLQCSFCAFFCPHVAVCPLIYVSFYWSRFAWYNWYHLLVSHIGRAVQLQLITPLYLGPGWGRVDQKGDTTAVGLKVNRPTNCFTTCRGSDSLFDKAGQQKQKIYATDTLQNTLDMRRTWIISCFPFRNGRSDTHVSDLYLHEWFLTFSMWNKWQNMKDSTDSKTPQSEEALGIWFLLLC